MTNLNNGFVSNRVLKINVGFLLHESGGTSRVFDFDLPAVRVADDLLLAYLRGPVRLTRTARGVLAQASRIAAGHEAECVRCLESFTLSLELAFEELYAFPPTPDAELSVADDGILDLGPLIRAEAIVRTPMGPLCRPDCRGLCPHCGHNLNQGPCDCEQEKVDPRLAILKSLRDND